MRHFEQALRACLTDNRESNIAELGQAWQTVVSRYSEAQIMLLEPVWAAAGDAYGGLRYTYDGYLRPALRPG